VTRTLSLAIGALYLLLAMSQPADAAELILNEYNAVSSTNYLGGGDAFADAQGVAPGPADPAFGRVPGNGGDWLELVVVADGLDIRNWALEIWVSGVLDTRLAFTSHPLWSNLAAGTIITVAQDVPEDPSYDPASGDWSIAVRAADLADPNDPFAPPGGTGTYITASNFPVNRYDWQLEIRDENDFVVSARTGEGTVPGANVSNEEVFKLEADPGAWIEPSSAAYDDGVSSTFGAPNVSVGNVPVQDFSALRRLAPPADRDGDGRPDDGDFSGLIGDTPCDAANLAGCDDNCPLAANAGQTDSYGNGVGDVCRCGDVDDDGLVTSQDEANVRQFLADPTFTPFADDKCGVVHDAECTVADWVVLTRSLASLAPEPLQVCEADAQHAYSPGWVFNPGRLLQIDLTLAAAEWDALRTQGLSAPEVISYLLNDPTCGDAPIMKPYTWFPADVTINGETLGTIAVRKKGFLGSLDSQKPSLKLSFDRYVAGQRYHGLERMTLNNAKQDPALVKQCLGYQFMADAGIPAPRCNFAQVRVNGQPLEIRDVNGGLVSSSIYVHVESVKPQFLERHFTDATGKLYEGSIADFTQFDSGDWRGSFEAKNAAALADTTELDALVDSVDNVAGLAFLFAADNVLDLEAFIRFWVAEGIVGHWDGYVNNQSNFWVYVNPPTGRMHFIPWGMDDILGRGDPAFASGEDPINAPPLTPDSALARRFWEQPLLRSIILDIMGDMIQNDWDAARYQAELDRMETLLTPVAGDLSAKLAPIRTWIGVRQSIVENALANPPAQTPPPTVHPCVY
jgi:hypothetical protein